MSNADKIGGIPLLSWIWNLRPVVAALVMIIADFGIICTLMTLEGQPPWRRQLYRTFMWNDTVFIPLYVAMTVVILQSMQPLNGYCTKLWWHLSILLAGFAVSLWLEYGAVKNGQFTMSQELSPSKLWHTFIFGLVFYWMVAPLVPIILSHKPRWAIMLLCLAIAGFGFMIYQDSTRPLPKEAHIEGTWQIKSWHSIRYPVWQPKTH